MASESIVLNLTDSTLWAPYKGLFNIVYSAVAQKDPDAIQDLEVALKKHKPDLICLLKNPTRSPIHREAIKKASSVGIAVAGQTGLQILPQSLIDEALIISDMFDLNEVTSLELLIAGQQQQPRFPGLTRGLVAMLLYYDGRRNLVNALQLLVQAREGHTWTLGVTPELSSIIMRYTNQLKEEGILMKIIDLVEGMNITEELELLHRNRALGGPKYRKQVTDLMKEIKETLAEILFGWACQGWLSKEEVLRLLTFLSKQIGVTSDGSMDETILTMSMAFLYTIDVSVLQTCDENDVVQRLNLVKEPDLSIALHKQLMNSPQDKWQMTGLKSIFQLAWGVTLRTLSQFPVSTIGACLGDCLEEDEKTVDVAIEDGAFQYLKNLVIKSSIFHDQEFFVKRIHSLVTDFIVLMPLKVKDLRNRGDETARIIASHIQAGLEPPENLPFHFEHLLNLIADLYAKDTMNLELAAEYWCPTESLFEQSYFQRPSPRQIALYKFIRLAGDMLPPPLFVPYHQMLTSLSNSVTCAHNCFSMLKLNGKNGNQSSIVSWDHFFATLHRYYSSLHEEVPANADFRYAYPQRMHSKGITPQEVHGLIAVLQLISQVVKLDEIARITLSENPQYVPTVVMLGLVTCSIPASLKAALINCLAAFATSPEIALNIWQGLEMAQVIPSVKSVSVYHPSGILMELEEVETRMEEYPVTRAMLTLLDSLLNHPYPPSLGSATRQPGIEPYIQFVRDSVLLRSNSRAYKTESEKWKIMGSCFKILEKILKNCHFYPSANNNLAASSNVGISVLSQMLQDSELLRVVLFILDEGMRILDQYASVPGQSILEDTTLLALQMIFVTLSKQEAFLEQIRESGCDLLVTSLDNLLLNINPRSGQADHLLVIAKYVTYSTFLPKHGLYSMSILHGLCSSIHISKHLVSVFDSDSKESEILLKGFVETLEADVTSENDTEDKTLVARNKARQQLLQLILKCLKHPGPNLSHYLLGFNLRKPIASTEIQEPGVMGAKRTCLHAVLAFLDFGGYTGTFPTNVMNCPYSAELAYKLIFMLCTNRDTSGPTLRYLRSTHDFLFRHLQFLPFKLQGSPEVKVLSQQSWLLRTLAVELRITSAHHQRSHVQRLLSCLLDNKAPLESGAIDVSLEPSLGTSNISSYSFMKPSSGTFRKKLMQILDGIDFQFSVPSVPHWEYFENEEIERLLKECEVHELEGPLLIDVEALHNRLSEETVGLKNASIMGQRPLMMQAITKVLQYAVSCNESRELVFAKKRLFDAWRQITEVLFISCPLEILGSERRDQLALEISQELLNKMLSADVMPELIPSASGVILTLMSTLRHSVLTSMLKPPMQINNNPLDSFSGEPAPVSLTHHSSLLVVLRNVVECLFKTGSGLQRVRANFYSSFLNLLCIVQKPYDLQSGQSAGIGAMILDQESEARKLRLEYMDTILSYGENIMEIVCRDACTGHDITKMLSLAVLDVAISLDTQQQWLAFLVSKGYLRHILDSLSKDDEELQNLFNRNSNSFRIFYVFDSKMALLTRISCCTNGALALLRNGAIHKLAECRALDLRPDLPSDIKDENSSWIYPDLLKCYRQMFMAIMRLILSITMTLGSSHREATLQLLEFVVCNGELFSHVIRDPSNLSSLEALEELSVISAVLSRAQFDDPSTLSSDTFLSEQRGHLLLLRQNSLLLLQRLMALENTENYKEESQQDSDVTARMKMYRLQIASHIIASCCSSVLKAGVDVQNSSILFSHHITIASAQESYHLMSSSFEKRLPLLIGRTPDLGLLISLLYRYASELLVSLDDQKLLCRRLQSLANLTSDELAEFIPPSLKHDQPSVQQHREIARNSLQKLLQYKDREISILSYIIESSAFVLLKHLEYYFACFIKEGASFCLPEKTLLPMRRLQGSTASPKSPQILSPRNNNSLSLSPQFDFESFKADVQATIGEPFFRKLKPVEQHLSQGKGHVSFLEAIVNRIKRLVRSQGR